MNNNKIITKTSEQAKKEIEIGMQILKNLYEIIKCPECGDCNVIIKIANKYASDEITLEIQRYTMFDKKNETIIASTFGKD